MGRREMTKKLSTVGHLLKEGYESGLTIRELGKIYEVSPGTIRSRLIEMGVPLRSRGRKRKE